MHLFLQIVLSSVLYYGAAASGSMPDCGANSTSQLSANGGCPKHCIRLRGVCVPENCLSSWFAWLHQPASVSCKFRWTLLIISGCILSFMCGLICYGLAHELRRCKRKWRMWQYSYFSDSVEESTA